MDPDRFCLEKAAPPGSSLHYATLFADARARAALVAVHAFRRCLLDIVEDIADANVRATKLNWWSNEIMEARDGRARHPVSVALTRHCQAALWFRPEVLAMLSTVARVSAERGLASETARDEFCAIVGGGTAALCAVSVPPAAGHDDVADAMRGPGAALEEAILAGAPRVRSGIERIPRPTTPDSAAAEAGRGGSRAGPGRTAAARARAHQALADALRGLPHDTGPVPLVYRTLARIQLAALAAALRKPADKAPVAASISPVRKLWIAWRVSRRAAQVESDPATATSGTKGHDHTASNTPRTRGTLR